MNREHFSIRNQIRTYVAVHSGVETYAGWDRKRTDEYLDFAKIDRAAWKTFGETHEIA